MTTNGLWALAPWTCPVCRHVLPRFEREEHPLVGATYHCRTCVLDLVVDVAGDRLTLVQTDRVEIAKTPRQFPSSYRFGSN